jgi:hypothetical protein
LPCDPERALDLLWINLGFPTAHNENREALYRSRGFTQTLAVDALFPG